MSLGKRFLGSRIARALVGLGIRAYRPLLFAGVRLLVDPRLKRLLRSKEPVVFVCWHQDFMLTIGYLSRFSPRRRSHALASASRDGGLAAAAVEALGFQPSVRGSSAGKGVTALRELERIATCGKPTSIVVVGDGPRPPPRELKIGALHVARSSGKPIWLVRTSWWPDRRIERSWARFHLVRPGTAGVLVCDGPIRVPSSVDRDELERLRQSLEARLCLLAARGDTLARERMSARSGTGD